MCDHYLKFDLQRIQKRYNSKITRGGLIAVKPMISEIHVLMNQAGKTWFNEAGERYDGFTVEDTSDSGFRGYSYVLKKDGNIVAESKTHWENGTFFVGFDLNEIESIIST